MKKDVDLVEDGVWDISDLEEKVSKPNQWACVGAKMFKAAAVTHETLPSGCYNVTMDKNDGSIIYLGKYIKSDKIIHFKDGLTNQILSEINNFWGKWDTFKTNGFLHRRGYLLYGPQGTGKSSVVWQIAEQVIKKGGIVFVCDNPLFFEMALKTFRQVESDRPVVCVFEDIDAIIKKYGDTEILSLLDGDNQIDRVINIATTNYPEDLDKRIVARPRRFDRIYKIVSPDAKIREAFLKEKLPKKENIKKWMKLTEGISFAGISEMLISVLCLGNKLEETAEIIKDLESKTPKESDFGNGGEIGFGKGEDKEPIDDIIPRRGGF